MEGPSPRSPKAATRDIMPSTFESAVALHWTVEVNHLFRFRLPHLAGAVYTKLPKCPLWVTSACLDLGSIHAHPASQPTAVPFSLVSCWRLIVQHASSQPMRLPRTSVQARELSVCRTRCCAEGILHLHPFGPKSPERRCRVPLPDVASSDIKLS